jgi:hypothetical protein
MSEVVGAGGAYRSPPSPHEANFAAVREVVLTGAFNPVSLEGTLVVDGVAASSYNSHVANFPPAVLHALLSPLRVWYRLHPASYVAVHGQVVALVYYLAELLMPYAGS